MVPVGTRLMLLCCVLYELIDSNNWLTYCKLGQFLFWWCTLLFLCGHNLFVFLRIVFNTVLLVCYCYSVLWLQISNEYLLIAVSDCWRKLGVLILSGEKVPYLVSLWSINGPLVDGFCCVCQVSNATAQDVTAVNVELRMRISSFFCSGNTYYLFDILCGHTLTVRFFTLGFILCALQV